MKTKLIIGLLAFGMLFPSKSNAQSLPSGKTIADNTYARNEGVSMSRKLTMELKDKRGKIRIRETTSLRKYFGEEKRLAIFYLTPKSIMGTAFLTIQSGTLGTIKRAGRLQKVRASLIINNQRPRM